MREVNPQVWYGERKLSYVPPHFVKATTSLTNEALNWVNAILVGRYTVSTYTDTENYFIETYSYIYFEDPAEAMMYELRWAGSK
jgi:hypothetical protein